MWHAAKDAGQPLYSCKNCGCISVPYSHVIRYFGALIATATLMALVSAKWKSWKFDGFGKVSVGMLHLTPPTQPQIRIPD